MNVWLLVGHLDSVAVVPHSRASITLLAGCGLTAQLLSAVLIGKKVTRRFFLWLVWKQTSSARRTTTNLAKRWMLKPFEYHLTFSERLKAAEQLVDFYGAGNVPPVHSEAESFILREKNSIDDMRGTLWPNAKVPNKAVHPDRWTGRNLFTDVEAADAAYGDQIKTSLGMSLAEYYRTEYRRMNWLIHSTMAGVTNLDRIYYSNAAVLALKWCPLRLLLTLTCYPVGP